MKKKELDKCLCHILRMAANPGTMLPKVKKQNLLEGTFWSSF